MTEQGTETSPERQPRDIEKPSLYDRMHLKMISLIHDTLYSLFVDPNRLLAAAGIGPGQTVLEVGCGPGFFTVPAAKILGPMGCLHSIDVNPAAVARVRQKVQASGLSNVDVTKADAAATGLDGQSVDVEFLFGIIHSLRDLDSVLAEAYRVLKRAGTLSAQKSSWPESRLLRRFTEKGLFRFVGKTAGVYRFEKVEQH